MALENERIKNVRKHLSLSQKDFAQALGIQQGSISDIERGKDGVGVSANIKMKLQNIYNVNIDYIENGNLPIIISQTSEDPAGYSKKNTPVDEDVYFEKHGVKIPINELVDHFVKNKDLYLEKSEYLKLWLQLKIEEGLTSRFEELGIKVKYTTED